MHNCVVRSGVLQPQILAIALTRMWCRLTILTRFGAVFFLLTLYSFLAPKLGHAQVPCELQYQHDVELGWNGNFPGNEHVFKTSNESTKVYVAASNCIGITVKKGTVSVVWYDKMGIPHQSPFGAGTTLTESLLKNAQSGSLLKQLHEYWQRVVSYYCSQCSEKKYAGARGGSDSVAELLHSAFSGVLVVGPNGLQVPFQSPELQNILSFRVRTGDITRRIVDGITFQNGILLIPPAVLAGDRSYIWEADIREADRAQSYTGRFVVAADVRTKATLTRLTEIRTASQGQLTFRQEAACYFEQGLQANATIAMIQELNALSKEE